MKALSIKQPWAGLIANGIKDIENREWTTRYRGLVLIHAGKIPDDNAKLIAILREKAPKFLETAMNATYERGGIIGYATLTDVAINHTSPWFIGPYGFMLKNCHPLPFIPCKGQLGFFNVSSDIEAQVNAMIGLKSLP